MKSNKRKILIASIFGLTSLYAYLINVEHNPSKLHKNEFSTQSYNKVSVQPIKESTLIMDPTIIAAIIGGIATVTAAIIARKTGRKEGREEKEQEIDDAPRKYVNHLDKLIQTAIQEGSSNAVINARAIVSTRNDLRESMMKISERLNSEIDRLAKELGESSGEEIVIQQASPTALYETIEVLKRKWPAKKDQVEIELRKVLAELGILGKSPKQQKP
jgi:gas vesicle protein